MEGIKFIIITGMSGAGKTEAIRCFEDYGYFCVDNLPPMLIPKFAELCAQSEGKVNRIALVSDIRGGGFFDSLFQALSDLEHIGLEYTILFLEASDEVLIRRFKETRRRHPLASNGGGILEGIHSERKRLEELRGRSDIIIDTSNLSPRQLKDEIEDTVLKHQEGDRLNITVVSFGFKYGLPIDGDLIFDVRFLPNPHYVASLKSLTGEDLQVIEYVLKWPVAIKFIEKLFDLMGFVMPYYVKEGKTHLMVAVGCTGGKHRSVVLADKLGEFLKNKGYKVRVEHRDINN